MKKISLSILFMTFICNFSLAQTQTYFNTIKKSHIPSLPGANISNIWGYTDANGKEYAIIGSGTATNIIDVSDCSNPVLMTSISDNLSTKWREYKVYKNFLYSVSEQTTTAQGNGGLKMFNLSNINNITYANAALTDNPATNDPNFFNNGHTLSIDTTKSRLYISGANFSSGTQSIIIYQLNPNNIKPTLLLKITNLSTYLGQVGVNLYIHDLYVNNDTIYASHTGGKRFNTYKFDSLSNTIQFLGSNSDVEVAGLNHSSWPHPLYPEYFYGAIEDPDKPMPVYKVTNNGTNISLKKIFKDPLGLPNFTNAVYHNPHAIRNELYVSAYNDGIQIYDISEPENPIRVAYFDTYPAAPILPTTGYNGFNGAWGVYPFFKSGCIVASDINTGFHSFKVDFRKVEIKGNLHITTPGKGIIFLDSVGSYTQLYVNGSGQLAYQALGVSSNDNRVDSADVVINNGGLFITGLDNQTYKITIDNNGNISANAAVVSSTNTLKITNQNFAINNKDKGLNLFSSDGQRWKIHYNSSQSILYRRKSAF